MNPYSPEQKYPKAVVKRALERCKQGQENTKFLIQVKETLRETVRRGHKALNHEFYDEPLILEDGAIVIPTPRAILEHEERHHAETIE